MNASLWIGHIIILALVQGITEFLPISSSAHLILLPYAGNWPDQGPILDVAVHVGTLLAVILYFRRDLTVFLGAALILCRKRPPVAEWNSAQRMAVYLVIATLPIIGAGALLAASGLQASLRSIELIGWASVSFGLLLYAADRCKIRLSLDKGMRAGQAITIGFAQILALIPGTSRAGITMTAARFIGFNREDSARFSMYLSIPTIAAAGMLSAFDLVGRGDVKLGLYAILAAILSFLVAMLAIDLLLRWLRRASFTPFVVYRVALGFALIAIAWAGNGA